MTMTAITEAMPDSSLELVEFQKFKSMTVDEVMSELVKEFGVVYVSSITRQGCSGCETQKPLYEALASRTTRSDPGKAKFRRFHINYRDDDKSESWESKRMFGHAAYPTYMIHVRSQVGPLEVYRSIYPSMDELEKQIRETFDLAEFYESEARAK